MNKQEMKKMFVVSALSLAIAGVNGVVYAEAPKLAPEDCVVEGGQGESLAEWGMWCGVGSFLAALSDLDPTAAGPGDVGGGFDTGPGDPTGRGEADNFEPGANQQDDPPADEPVTPHIAQPAGDGEFVGYFASQDYTYEYDYEEENEGDGYGEVSNHQTGGFSLSLQDGDMYDGYGDFFFEGYGDGYGDGYGEGYGDPDTVDYARYDKDGNPIDGDSFSSDDDYYVHDEDGGAEQETDVELEDSEYFPGYFEGYRDSHSHYPGSPYDDAGEGIVGMEVVVYNDDSEGYGGPVLLVAQEYEVLKNYWAGYFGNYTYDYYSRDGGIDTGRHGAFVAGVFTTLDEIQAMISGDVSAVYTGNSHQWMQSVRLEVDFGDESFSGEFGDMDDYRKGMAGIDMEKDMSFTAEGVIDGVHLISESVSADAGFVQGSFFGEEGRIIGGAYDITKQGDRVVDVFTAVEGEGNRVEVEEYYYDD
jgi:hypothetical protein